MSAHPEMADQANKARSTVISVIYNIKRLILSNFVKISQIASLSPCTLYWHMYHSGHKAIFNDIPFDTTLPVGL